MKKLPALLLFPVAALLSGCGVFKLKNDTLFCIGVCAHADTEHEKGEAPKDLPKRPAEGPTTD